MNRGYARQHLIDRFSFSMRCASDGIRKSCRIGRSGAIHRRRSPVIDRDTEYYGGKRGRKQKVGLSKHTYTNMHVRVYVHVCDCACVHALRSLTPTTTIHCVPLCDKANDAKKATVVLPSLMVLNDAIFNHHSCLVG